MKDLFRDIINFIVLPFELYFLKKVLKKRKRAGSLLQEIRELDEVVFVLSPHSDDEALGVGGMIKGMHHSTDFFIFIPTLERGKEGNVRLKESESVFSFASEKVHITPGGFKDGNLLGSLDDLRETVKEIIVGKKIKTIFAPLPTELHPDHSACSMIVLDLLNEKVIDRAFFFSTNHLFLPEMINSYHAFPGGKNAKLNMLRRYKSQRKINFRKIVGIENVYSEMLDCPDFSEVFYKINKEDKEKTELVSESLCSLAKNFSTSDFGSVSRIFGIIRFAKNNLKKIRTYFNLTS